MRIKVGQKNDLLKVNIDLFMGIIVYRLLLDLVYIKHVSKLFKYTGLTSEFKMHSWLFSWLILLLAIPMIKTCTTRCAFSDAIILFLIYLSYIPFTTMISYYPFSWQYILANSVYWIVLFMSHKCIPVPQKRIQFHLRNNHLWIYLIEAVFGITIVYISWRFTGFRFTINLENVYSMRNDENLGNIPALFSYIFAASKVTLPILMAYSLKIKNKINLVIIIVLQILSFSVNGSKTVLFSTLIAVVAFYLYDDRYLNKISIFFSLMTLLSYLETEITGGFFILATFIRRVLFVPNQLGYYYYSFFSENEPDYYKQSFLRLFGFKSKYDDIDHVIGGLYFNRADMGANNGLISDAITNMGFIGVVIMPIILVIVFRILDKCSKSIDKHVFISVAIVFSFVFLSTFLPTVLLTHGLLAVCIILMVIPSE